MDPVAAYFSPAERGSNCASVRITKQDACVGWLFLVELVLQLRCLVWLHLLCCYRSSCFHSSEVFEVRIRLICQIILLSCSLFKHVVRFILVTWRSLTSVQSLSLEL